MWGDVAKLKPALLEIAAYADGSPHDGCCPYGCDTPHIAATALSEENRVLNKPSANNE